MRISYSARKISYETRFSPLETEDLENIWNDFKALRIQDKDTANNAEEFLPIAAREALIEVLFQRINEAEEAIVSYN